MNTERTPKVGEVWTSNYGLFTCLVDTPDRLGDFVWMNTNRTYYVLTAKNLTPPPVPLPESFVNVYANGRNGSGHKTRDDADANADPHRVAVLHLHPDGHTTIDRLDGRGEQ